MCVETAVVSNLHGTFIIMNLAQNVLLVLSKCVCVCVCVCVQMSLQEPVVCTDESDLCAQMSPVPTQLNLKGCLYIFVCCKLSHLCVAN